MIMDTHFRGRDVVDKDEKKQEPLQEDIDWRRGFELD